ncbi:serine hydrolase domain-containing protein [Leucobacter soli]|uniref:D-aminopeptidase n=1 Tax=Leucobacter soli TaxID=2812850 RepID=A0A916NWH0_9MICO|nr:serine hydrolase domain-containing protein [Leucobacter soli]CAG7616835.1 D-aminopeptidase [Leucobacter soli]
MNEPLSAHTPPIRNAHEAPGSGRPASVPAQEYHRHSRLRHSHYRHSHRLAAAAGLGILALLLAGCAPAGSAGITTTVGDTPNQDVVSLPGEVDVQIEQAVEALPGLAEAALRESGVPGLAVAVVHGDRIVFAEGYGVRQAGTDAPITADTVFQVASVSKPLAATGVAAANGASDGSLSWDTPISELLPEFAFSDPLVTERATVGDAFSHRTGLSTGAGDDLEDLGFDRATILDRLRLQPLDDFRSSYHYSNFGLTVGAEAVAASRHESWDALMDELVFGPLGMASSSARHDDFLTHEDRARLHALEDGEFVAKYDRDPDAEAPAGGVSSTVNDLARWVRMLLAEGVLDGEQIADPDALAAAMSAQTVSGTGPGIDGRPSHYGFGFNASPQVGGRMAISHSGAFVLGAATSFQIVPTLDLGIVVLTNGAPVGVPEAVAAQFLDLVQYGQPTRDWVSDARGFFAGYTTPIGDLVDETSPADPEPAPNPQSLIGVYDSAYFGELRVSETDGDLLIRLGAGLTTELALIPWDGTIFSYSPSSESAPWGSLSSARFSDDGQTLTLDSFDEHGLGTWTKRE